MVVDAGCGGNLSASRRARAERAGVASACPSRGDVGLTWGIFPETGPWLVRGAHNGHPDLSVLPANGSPGAPLAFVDEHVRADMIDSAEFPTLVQRYRVHSVLRTIVNGKPAFEGALPGGIASSPSEAVGGRDGDNRPVVTCGAVPTLYRR